MHSMNLTAQLNPSTYTRKFSSCSLRRNPNCCLSAGRAGYFSNPGLLANTFTTTRVSSFSRGRARCVPTPPLCYSRKCSLARARQLDWQESAKARCDGRKVGANGRIGVTEEVGIVSHPLHVRPCAHQSATPRRRGPISEREADEWYSFQLRFTTTSIVLYLT